MKHREGFDFPNTLDRGARAAGEPGHETAVAPRTTGAHVATSKLRRVIGSLNETFLGGRRWLR